MKFFSKKGFTLIELLVVISIIGLLSSVVLASVNTARAKGRDAARVQTVSQIKNALELYYADNKSYPTGGVTAESLVSNPSGPLYPYLKSVSPNFAVTGGAATSYLSNGANYEILLQTETTGGAFSKSIGCVAADYSAYPTTNKYCYGNNPTVSLGTPVVVPVVSITINGTTYSSGQTANISIDQGTTYFTLSWSSSVSNVTCSYFSSSGNYDASGLASSGTVQLPVAGILSDDNDPLAVTCGSGSSTVILHAVQ